ncbi:MAG: hypothetical protein GY898_29565, partial [Proteobacteria bacterium]|nr:hypothetical protein [Pseudomonadota bacterium]
MPRKRRRTDHSPEKGRSRAAAEVVEADVAPSVATRVRGSLPAGRAAVRFWVSVVVFVAVFAAQRRFSVVPGAVICLPSLALMASMFGPSSPRRPDGVFDAAVNPARAYLSDFVGGLARCLALWRPSVRAALSPASLVGLYGAAAASSAAVAAHQLGFGLADAATVAASTFMVLCVAADGHRRRFATAGRPDWAGPKDRAVISM